MEIDMTNMFDRAAQRAEEQEKIENHVSKSRQTEKRTILSLSLTESDKKTLKIMAADQGITIAKMIHNWISEHKEA